MQKAGRNDRLFGHAEIGDAKVFFGIGTAFRLKWKYFRSLILRNAGSFAREAASTRDWNEVSYNGFDTKVDHV